MTMPQAVSPSSFLAHPFDVVLASVANVRIMRAIIAHGGALSVTRLAHETCITPNGTRGALYQLERAGIVHAIGSGRSRLFQSTPGHVLVPALEALFAAERARKEELTASVATVAKESGAISAWLFGSAARGQDTFTSDVDIAVVFNLNHSECESSIESIRDRLTAIERRLGVTVSVTAMSFADIRRLQAERAPLWTDLLTEARVMFGMSPQQVARTIGKAQFA